MKKSLWCDRTLTTCAYHFRLCLSQADFYAELKRLEVPVADWPEFITGKGHATTHAYSRSRGKGFAIVCLDTGKPGEYTGVQICALLCHEAVHIWQKHVTFIGSFNDHGAEEEAYAIQNIAQELMESYQEQTA